MKDHTRFVTLMSSHQMFNLQVSTTACILSQSFLNFWEIKLNDFSMTFPGPNNFHELSPDILHKLCQLQ